MPSNGKMMDNLPVMGPAGTVHMSLEDWGKFVTEHLKGRRGKSEYLSQATFARLHTAIKGDYAMGWITARRPWAGGIALNHTGDNTMNYANVWVAPEKGFAVLVATNQSESHAATDEVAAGLIGMMSTLGKQYPKRAPYGAVRWEGEQPVVKIGRQWFTLESIDGVDAADIVAFSKQNYSDKWQKRFEEDLVEVMAKMGHMPKDAVQLVVRPPRSTASRTLKDVAMTEANRQAIRAASAAR